jgi:hypothetical protein
VSCRAARQCQAGRLDGHRGGQPPAGAAGPLRTQRPGLVRARMRWWAQTASAALRDRPRGLVNSGCRADRPGHERAGQRSGAPGDLSPGRGTGNGCGRADGILGADFGRERGAARAIMSAATEGMGLRRSVGHGGSGTRTQGRPLKPSGSVKRSGSGRPLGHQTSAPPARTPGPGPTAPTPALQAGRSGAGLTRPPARGHRAGGAPPGRRAGVRPTRHGGRAARQGGRPNRQCARQGIASCDPQRLRRHDAARCRIGPVIPLPGSSRPRLAAVVRVTLLLCITENQRERFT